MPAKWFRCPDGQTIEIERCLSSRGCRMKERCGPIPYLRMVGYDREWRGVTPSMAGNGARLIHLQRTTDYAIDPCDRAFAALGSGVHGKLSIHQYTYDVLSEEQLSDEKAKGIADLLTEDEDRPNAYVLTDYKTWGSFKVAKAIGLCSKDVPLLDSEGNVILLKSGPNKGFPKMEKRYFVDPSEADIRETALQLNRYRIFFEANGFPISKMEVYAIVRDGNTHIAKSRGIEKPTYVVPVPYLTNKEVLDFYDNLAAAVEQAYQTGWAPKCNAWESWDGRRCSGYCDVSDACARMDQGRAAA